MVYNSMYNHLLYNSNFYTIIWCIIVCYVIQYDMMYCIILCYTGITVVLGIYHAILDYHVCSVLVTPQYLYRDTVARIQ